MYIHAFDPTDFQTCNNLAIRPLILSPNCLALVDPGIADIHERVEDLPLSRIKAADFASVVTPRARVYSLGYMLKTGMTITDGYGSLLGFGDADHYMRIYNSELTMEVSRRQVAPNAPSRLGCLWFAEEGPRSRDMLQEMFELSRHIVSVSVAHENALFRADASFYDRLVETGESVNADLYWRGERLAGKWEYLLDGALEVTDQGQLDILIQDCRECGSFQL